MSARTLNRKQFLVFGASTVAASVLGACGEDDPGSTGGSSGSAGSGTAGSSGSSAGGSASGSGGSGTAGSASGSGGSAAGAGGSSAGSGGSTAGSGGSTAGSGGASGGSGGGGGSAGAAGGMCGSANITQTSDELHDHIPQDPTMLKMDLKTFINTATPATLFTVPNEGQGGGHIHTFKLTAEQISTLKGGGMVTGIETSEDDNHTHVYTLSCMA